MERIRAEEIDKLTCLMDLHLHLDGAISPASARDLAALQGIDIPKSDGELLNLLRVSDDCRDLNEFLKRFAFPCSLLMTREGMRRAVKNLLTELKQQGVMYAEIRFAPQYCLEKGCSQEDIVQAAIEGLREGPVPANLILCCMRGKGREEANRETLRLTEKYLGKGVVAADLAGAEALFPNTDYEDLFREAKARKIPYVLHAGEGDGPESVRTALAMEPLRIGHGVRSYEDPELVGILAEKQVPLELCPTNNVKTAIFKSLAEYPLRTFLNAGMYVTINSDDPSVEGTDTRKEYKYMAEEFRLSREEFRRLLENSVKASFATEEQKAQMMKQIEKEI